MVASSMVNVGAALAQAKGPLGEEIPDDVETEGMPTQKKPLAGQWTEFINQPGNAAAMIQFGIKAMQPVSPGQSTMGHLANAIGAGGEAKQRVVEGQTERSYKQAQTDLLTNRSNFYAKGGGMTAYQQAMIDARNDTRVLEGMKSVMLYDQSGDYGGTLDPATLPPDQFMELYTRVKQSMTPALTPTGGGATSAPSLGGAVDPNAARRDAAAAIAKGADRTAVLKRLQEMGVPTDGI